MTTQPVQQRTRPSLGARLKGLVASLGIMAIVIGLPLALHAIGADPIPHHLPDVDTIRHDLFTRDDGTLALKAIVALAWIAWLVMTILIIVEIIVAIGHLRAPRLRGLSGPQAGARNLVAAAAMLFATGGTIGNVAPALAAPVHHAAPVTAATAVPGTTSSTASTGAAATADHTSRSTATAQPTFAYTVREGDNLWDLADHFLGDGQRYTDLIDLNQAVIGNHPSFLEQGTVLRIPRTEASSAATHSYTVRAEDTLEKIAAAQLGDPDRWPEIYKASAHITQPDGTHLSNPDVIFPGYTLHIPHLAEATATPAPSIAIPHQPAAPHHEHTAPAPSPQPSQTQPSQPATEQPSSGLDAGQGDGGPATPAHQDPTHQTPAPEEAPAQHGADSAGQQTQHAETDTHAEDQAGSILAAPWVIGSLAGGAVLSAAMIARLRMRRRAQFRARRPGRAIAAPAPELVAYEKTAAVAGDPMGESIDALDLALRQLALDIAASHGTAPPLAAVELSETGTTLHLTEPADLPDPWTGSPDRLRWSAPNTPASPTLSADRYAAPAPFPLLATIGRDDAGHWWLLNLEHVGAVTISGDTDRAKDLLRYIAAELALTPWADAAHIDGVGIGAEAARMDPTRITYHPTDGTSADTVLASALEMIDRSHDLDTDAPTGRSTQVDDEIWLARLLLVDATTATDEHTFARLIELIDDNPDHTGASIVIADHDLEGGFAIDLTDTGRLQVAGAGLDLVPVGLPEDDADACAMLLEQSDDVEDVPMPVDEDATEGLAVYIDTAGAIRPEWTIPRNVHELGEEEPAPTWLEGEDEEYAEAAAVTEDDLERIAPRIKAEVSEKVIDADPTREEDFRAWTENDPARPKLRLLGPVTVTAYGEPPEGRLPYYTELVAYLATKSKQGATTDEIGEAFGINENRVRKVCKVVRDWLGTNPVTGEFYLPYANKSPIALAGGANCFQLDTGPNGLIVDTDLFVRMKAAAQAKGEAGMEDLRRALVGLVDGKPFDKVRKGGWSWLFEGDRLDEQAKVAVADAAHVLTTHYLKQGDIQNARAVVTIGITAAPYEETMQLNMARVMKAEGRADEAEKLLQTEVFNRSDDGLPPTELSERTKKIISSWKATG